MFSESTGNVFCYVCKFFGWNIHSVFVKRGFSNWKKGEETISGHESSKDHGQCMLDWKNFLHKDSHVDKGISDTMELEVNYWREVLKQVVSAIRYLAERGLPFRGSDETFGSPNNGNYLGALELISEYDPFLKRYIDSHANKGRGTASYLSKTICEEFIELMANKMVAHINDEMKKAKYWGLVVDSTPDISHVDQLSVIFRYYLHGHIYERFFCFIQIGSHQGESLSKKILQLIEQYDIAISDCPAQTYDNASNMSGKYKGLQAWIKQQNDLAIYVPCVGHSLNLVGENSVGARTHASRFVSLLQGLYAFFSASTKRCIVLIENTKSKLTSLSETRWTCKADATNALVDNFDGVYQALLRMNQDETQKTEARKEAKRLMEEMKILENAFMAIFWYQILNRFNAVSKFLQKAEVDLNSANAMLLSLIDFVESLRTKFLELEGDAKKLSII